MSDMVWHKDTYCSFCGSRHLLSDSYPKLCSSCGMATYLNASAVGVGLVTLNDGLLVVQRAIPPHVGEWALPGGYKDLHETWEQGVAREIFEETGITVDDKTITLSAVKNADNGSVLIFGLCRPVRVPEPIQFTFDAETSDAKIITAPIDLCFPHHQELADWYFDHMSQDLKGT